MTDEQFKQYMQVQIAQLAALDAIAGSLQALAVKQGVAGGGHWDRVRSYLKNAAQIKPEQ